MTGPIYRRERRDANEPAIRRVVEEAGGTFLAISVKHGPDALVGHAGQTEAWEIKNGAKKLRPGQETWAAEWRGGPVAVVRNEAQARKRLRMMAERRPTLGSVLAAEHALVDAGGGTWDAVERADREAADDLRIPKDLDAGPA